MFQLFSDKYWKRNVPSGVPYIPGCLRSGRGLTGGFLLLRNFSVAISVSPHVCYIFVLILISMFLRICIYELGIFHAHRTTKFLRNQGRTKGECFIAGRLKMALLFLSRPPFFCSWLVLLLLCLMCLFALYVILALWPSVLQYQLPALLFFVFYSFSFVVRSCFSGEPKQNQGRGLVDHN